MNTKLNGRKTEHTTTPPTKRGAMREVNTTSVLSGSEEQSTIDTLLSEIKYIKIDIQTKSSYVPTLLSTQQSYLLWFLPFLWIAGSINAYFMSKEYWIQDKKKILLISPRRRHYCYHWNILLLLSISFITVMTKIHYSIRWPCM